MVKLMKIFMTNVKVSKKIIIMDIIIILFPALIFGCIINYKFQDIMKDGFKKNYQNIADQYLKSIDYKLKIYENILNTITMSNSINSLFTKSSNGWDENFYMSSNEISDQIKTLIYDSIKSEIYRITLYSMDNSFPSDSRHLDSIKSIEGEAWYNKELLYGESIFFYNYASSGNAYRASFTKPIVGLMDSNILNRLGFVKIDVEADKLFNFLDFNIGSELSQVYLLDNRSDKVFSSSRNGVNVLERSEVPKTIRESVLGKVDKTFNNKEIIIEKKSNQGRFSCVFVFSYENVKRKLFVNSLFLYFGIFAFLLIVICMNLIFVKALSTRLSLLSNKIQSVQVGDFDIKYVIPGRDEIAEFGMQFDEMTKKLRRLIDENYIQELKKKEAEFYALQFQINPHFLYNTLQAIDSIACRHDRREISAIVQNLGEMYRYNMQITKKEYVMLKDEINHIKNYIFIEKVRYNEGIEVFYNVEKDVMSCLMLKFVLQPLVENAIKHGFKDKKRKLFIEIFACIESKYLRINVIDDGAGMADSQVAALNKMMGEDETGLEESGKKGIGVRNVNARIKMMYGGEYGISVESKLGRGTNITIRLPAKRLGEEMD